MRIKNYKIILASQSPRRKELLTQAGFTFDIIPSDEEEEITEDKPEKAVMALAESKAKNVFARVSDPAADVIVIGADTIVTYMGEILGKPEDEVDAMGMLSLLSDRKHQVYTGVSLVIRTAGKVKIHTFYEKTDVTFYPISREDLKTYIATKDPMDKAGSYGIQGPFAIHVKKISGDYNNVVGLPIARLYQELVNLKN